MVLSFEQAKKLRRSAIALARRRQKFGTGSAYSFLTRRTADMEWFDLSTVLTQLNWAVIGAVATRHYMAERMTKDLDVAIIATDARLARQQLQAAGFVYQSELSIGGSHWLAPNNQEIDVIEGNESWWPLAIKEAQNNRDLQGLPILPLPWLALSKFRASRLQDIADLSRMLGQANQNQLEQVREIFRQYTNQDDLDDLQNIIELGQLELGG